ncbi:hypothetical protein [Pedobacter alpinus]|uniref:T9SS C-terminal target domain-containing protein n=1 Tax=Pedobacter alpinus TaxID=1590643 RepID=A0ABW5TQN5_9SPHI
MKNLLKSNLLVLLAASAITIASCGKDDDIIDSGQNGVLPNNTVITGDITSNVTLGKGNTYFLKGGVHVKANNTIKIEEGVTIKSDAVEVATAYLLIEPGAKIDAQGTATAPIVMTSGKATPMEQDWGGLIICGKAPSNPGATVASEMGAGVNYGGTDVNDNSGIIRYVRVEYTGKKQTATKEHNGITFEGVGAGTKVEYICSYRGGDDGFEMFGGTVDIKYAVVFGAQDDLFDWTFGWKGKGQFWVGIQNSNTGSVADRGFEADNNGSNNAAAPFSEPTISNVTLVGSLTAKTGDDPLTAIETGKTIGLKLREGTKAKLYNFVIYNFSNGIDIEHNQSLANMADGSLFLKNSDVVNVNPHVFKNTTPSGGTRPSFTGTNMLIDATYLNTFTATSTTPSYISNVYVGTSATGAFNPTTLGSYFTAAQYKGAVQSSNNWVTTGTWARVN